MCSYVQAIYRYGDRSITSCLEIRIKVQDFFIENQTQQGFLDHKMASPFCDLAFEKLLEKCYG